MVTELAVRDTEEELAHTLVGRVFTLKAVGVVELGALATMVPLRATPAMEVLAYRYPNGHPQRVMVRGTAMLVVAGLLVVLVAVAVQLIALVLMRLEQEVLALVTAGSVAVPE